MHDNQQKKAVALRYQPENDNAPRVIAKGRGYIAKQIEELAEEYNIPIKEDNQLVEYLTKLDLYEEIPPELYGVVAEILAFIFTMDRDYQGEY
ncbi:FhlB [Candidatus Syntrophocurvum alkaliphilum]|uniref:FhlB n=1 Tax=Candidatus Syntrophocurvum alkaliphilum TaxID=2293317 RepID=A0A6I6DL62_9FIRM|nr:EscU/YscU/HrcU family type III secretion system export apparatus switch protein [Candidatus Syntrophocurvum alkaliphilum]QGT99951.1 FhlB [Candidatus Syntrophocurvum alkaliphilum]